MAYYLGTQSTPHFAKLILLDVHYNARSDDVLGENQWTWLEKQLNDPSPHIFFIASGIQIIPDDRIQQSWDSPSRKRLY